VAAEFADEWNGVFNDRPTYRERSQLLDDCCGAGARSRRGQSARCDADQFRLRRCRLAAHSSERNIDARTIGGSASMVIDQNRRLRRAGRRAFHAPVLALDDIDRIEALAQAVLPHFHKA